MRKKDEAMKLALEALEYIHEGANNQGPHTGISWRCVSKKAEPAITAIREALAEQPAQQEPVAWKLVPTKPTEEMLKAMDECSKEGYDERLYAGHAASVYMAAVDAAPTPPAQRKPLTDEEIIASNYPDGEENGPTIAAPDFELICFARQIEAKLKEKNNG